MIANSRVPQFTPTPVGTTAVFSSSSASPLTALPKAGRYWLDERTPDFFFSSMFFSHA
jgi:hypothetical protein